MHAIELQMHLSHTHHDWEAKWLCQMLRMYDCNQQHHQVKYRKLEVSILNETEYLKTPLILFS